ncbi:hypothetical protein [Streptacidiphilus sp. P02-A3a]|uniref:hypothetical protein n=1 Tax=Streptacidiphilus sp. P02-A3a TaxID=2704468 RepID=UPI0015FA565E|nr:hypothetical protein [Streptacidiphilus sp. P02-A3a]QMU70666.1 hypothetical protein GXP74_23130 [Streptacidiphilus sp. P02-A3a]
MAFVRGPGPVQEPPQRQPRGPLLIGVAVLLVFFVPLLVVTAERGSPSAPSPSSSPALALSTAAPGTRIPPMPPAGAPWPPPAGAPQPPVCVLVYRAEPGGGTAWTALTTLAGQLTVGPGSTGGAPGLTLPEPEGVNPVTLPAALARDHGLRATLVADGGQRYGCLVGAERRQRHPASAAAR